MKLTTKIVVVASTIFIFILLIFGLNWSYSVGYETGYAQVQKDIVKAKEIALAQDNRKEFNQDNVMLRINEYRLAHELDTFSASDSANKFAQKRIEKACAEGQLTHNGLVELNQGQYSVGEIIGREFATPKLLVEAWDQSPTHQFILKNPIYTVAGIAIDGNCVVVNLFVR